MPKRLAISVYVSHWCSATATFLFPNVPECSGCSLKGTLIPYPISLSRARGPVGGTSIERLKLPKKAAGDVVAARDIPTFWGRDGFEVKFCP